MAWVWEHSKSNPTQRLVLLAIADCANDDGLDAYPSLATLMRKTGLGERAVQNAIKGLKELGELHVSGGGGRGLTNRYRVLMIDRTENPARETPFEEPETPHEKPRLENPASKTPFLATENPAPDAGRTIQEPKNSPTGSSTRARTRGTRLPDDFTVTSEMRTWALEHVPQLARAGETEKFVDYWRAQPGQKGVKVDWVATWRNWMRRAAEQLPAGSRASPPSTAPAAVPLDEQCPKHRGQRKGKCRECRADALAKGVPYP